MEKKSSVNSLKSTKKAKLAASPAKNEGTATRKATLEFARKATVKFARMS